MLPYGIVYNEIPHLYEKSIEIAEKKCGMLNFKVIGKFYAVALLLIVLPFTVAGLILKDDLFLPCMFFHCIVTVIYIKSTVKKAEVKGKAKATLSKTPIQIVFNENSFVITEPCYRSEYSYQELTFCNESHGLITMVVDGILTLSIPCNGILKGDYYTVCSILSDKLKNRYICKGDCQQ